MDVHLRDLRYFVAVAEELHFTRAAQRLHLSQPALSKQIRRLEQSLRVTLFTRDRRSVTLTAAGQALLDVACSLLPDWDAGQQRVSQAAAQEAAVLRIGITTALGRGLLPALRAAFARRRPDWRLEVRQVAWSDPTAGLASQDSDAAIVWLPVPGPERFRWRTLLTEPMHVALPSGHRLAADRGPVTMADLIDEPFVALPPAADVHRDHWLALHARDGRPARVAAVAASADETFELIGAGLGVALLAAGNAELYRRDDVVDRPVADLGPTALAVVWRADDERPAVRDLVDASRALGTPENPWLWSRVLDGGRGADHAATRRV